MAAFGGFAGLAVALAALALLASLDRSAAAGTPDDSLKALITFTFAPGASRLMRAAEATECMAGTPPAVADMSVLTAKTDSGTCWTDGRYNNGNFTLENGTLRGSDGSSLVAYRVSPPQQRATQFVASDAALYFRGEAGSTVVPKIFDGAFFKSLPAVPLTAGIGGFTKLGVNVGGLASSTIYVVVTAGARASAWPLLSSTAEGAVIASSASPRFRVTARRLEVGGRPFAPERDFQDGGGGPGSMPKKLFPVRGAGGVEGVVWQDQGSQAVFVSWLASDRLSMESKQLLTGLDSMVAAAGDGQSRVALLMMSTAVPATPIAPLTVTAVTVHTGTGQLTSVVLPTGPEGLKIWKQSGAGASMVWHVANDTLGIVLATLLPADAGGLNHQHAVAFVLDAKKLEIVGARSWQTSSHSFYNSLTLDSGSNFLGMDFGDNYPRGVNVWRFTQSGIKSRLVYTMKAKHMTNSGSGKFEAYTEISTAAVTFYKWSNDNQLYGELGHPGLVEVSDGLLAFFTGERPPLNYSMVGQVFNTARNVAFVKVPKDLASGDVLSRGANESGGFYSYGGGYTPQLNRGVSWLTDYTNASTGTVSRLKTAQLSPGVILLTWELWAQLPAGPRYVKTQLMVVDGAGAQLLPVTDLPSPLQLALQDDPVVLDGRAVAYAGTAEGRIARFEFCALASCPSPTEAPAEASGGHRGAAACPAVLAATAAAAAATLSVAAPF